MYGVLRWTVTKLLEGPKRGRNPAAKKSTFVGGGITEGKGLTAPPVSYGCDSMVLAGSVGSVGTMLGSKKKSAPPAKGGSSVAQSDIQPFRVSSNIPKPPRRLVFPLPKGSQAKPNRGAKFLRSGKYQPFGAPESPGNT